MLSAGYFTVGRISGVPIRLHWSVPLGALLASRGRFAPGIWLGFFLLVILHEAGHAFLVRRRKLGVLSIDVHALGGVCRWSGSSSALDVSIIACGGVLAQACLLALAVALTSFVPVRDAFVAQLVEVMIPINLSMIALNLLPFRPFDGAEAWRIFGRLRASRPPLRAPSPPKPIISLVRPAPRRRDDDEELPPLPGDIKSEMERIVREATLARRRNGGRNDPN